jgi:hypothetical protein
MYMRLTAILCVMMQLTLASATIESLGPEKIGNYNISFNYDDRFTSMILTIAPGGLKDPDDQMMVLMSPDYSIMGGIYIDHNNSSAINTDNSIKRLIKEYLNESNNQIDIRDYQIDHRQGVLGIEESARNTTYLAIYELVKPNQQLPGSTLCRISLYSYANDTLPREAVDAILKSIHVEWLQPTK